MRLRVSVTILHRGIVSATFLGESLSPGWAAQQGIRKAISGVVESDIRRITVEVSPARPIAHILTPSAGAAP